MSAAPFSRLVSPGVTSDGRLFIEINYKPSLPDDDHRGDGAMRLSITGVEGPKANGNARGSCGQCRDALDRIEPHNRNHDEGWTNATIVQLREVWDRWHLNDMRAGTPAQSAWLREHGDEFPGYPTSHYEWASKQLAAAGLNPDDGYRYGSAWLYEDVPDDVLAWLESLPETTYSYPWRRSA